MPMVPFVEKIPSLTQGISRQAPSVRFPGQVSDARNVNFSVVDGARKRRGSEHLTNVGSASPAYNYRMHRIERDDTEEYAVIYGRNYLKVVDVNSGAVVTPTHTAKFIDGTTTDVLGNGCPSTSQYFGHATATEKNLKFVTIADVTFMVNSDVIPRVTSPSAEMINYKYMPICLVRTGAGSNLAFEWRWGKWKTRSYNRQIIKKQSSYQGYFRFYHRGLQSTHLDWRATPEQVEKAIQGNGIDPNELLQEIIQQVTTTVGGQQNTDTIYTGVNRCIDPANRNWQGPHPFPNPWPGNVDSMAVVGIPSFPYGKVIVTGGPLDKKDMIVQISTDLQMEAPNDAITSSAHTITIGDNETDPAPPFAKDPLSIDTGGTLGLPIRDIGYLRNRLMIACDEFVCFSAIDDMFNFYMEEPPNLVDSDPISVQLAANDVCLVDYIVPFRKSIVILTSSGQQFELTGGDTLAPDTAAVSPSTKYETQDIRPVQIGNRLYMAGGASTGYSTLLEYFYDEAQVSNIAVNLTKHVDDLIPPNLIAMDASSSQEMVFVIPEHDTDLTPETITSNASDSTPVGFNLASSWVGTDVPQPYDTFIVNTDDFVFIPVGETNGGSGIARSSDSALTTGSTITGKMFAYRSYNVGNERKQSAWTQWDFGTDRIMDAATFDDTLIVLRRVTYGSNGTSLVVEKLDLSELPTAPAGFNRNPHLDHRIHFAADPGSWNGSVYTVNISASDTSLPTNYVDTDLNRIVLADGTEHAATINAAGTQFTVASDISHKGEFYAGRAIRAQLVLSQAYARDKEKRPITEGRTVLKKTVVEHRRSSEYDVNVVNSQEGRTRTTGFTPASAGTTETGTLTVWCHGESKDTSITLDSNNAAPCIWTSVETHGNYDTLVTE